MTKFTSPSMTALLFAVLALAGALFMTPAMAQTQSLPGTIALVGEGQVTGTPDMAIVSSGVVTMGKTARDALSANTAAMDNIFALLRAAGMDPKDIQTANFNVEPQYDYSDQRDANGYSRPPRISSYQVSNTVSVKIHDLDNLGKVLDQLVTAGSNQINSVYFTVIDPAPLYDEARRAAMADAIEKANLYAKAAGVTLGPIISITEGSPQVSPVFKSDVMMARVAAESPAPVPIAAGQLDFSKQVSVVWKLEQN